MKHRILSLLLLAALLCGLLGQTSPPARAAADGSPAPVRAIGGKCGDSVNWSFDPGTGEMCVSGSGAMYDTVDYHNAAWDEYRTDIVKLTVGEGVTCLGWNAFRDCSALRSVKLPSTLTKLGNNAFAGCSSLESITLPDSLITIGASCFWGCALKAIVLPKKLERLGPSALANNSSLRVVAVRNPKCRVQCAESRYQSSTGTWTSWSTKEFGSLSKTVVIGKHDASLFGAAEEIIQDSSSHKSHYQYIEPYATEVGYRFFELNHFTDVPEGKYYEIPVALAVGLGITGGTGGGKFSPNKTCTREQVVSFLYAAQGKPDHSLTNCPFTDVKAGKYYYDAVLWAYENHITGGTTATKFGVGQPCTRAQIMTFLWKSLGSPEPGAVENPFTDVKSDKYYYKPILWAYKNGITGGMTPTKFGVGNSCTRAQTVTFLYGAYLLD